MTKKLPPSLGPAYGAAALQLTVHSVNRCPDRESARIRMNATIAHVAEKVRGTKRWAGPSLKLVVLPEYFLTCYPQGESVAAWADKAALEVDGPEYDALAKIAQDNKIFLAGNAYETDRHFPGFYFQTCFVIDPAGKVVLRYRRLNSMFAPTPHDVWDKYLDLYGLEGVFPVARTEIGNLAAIASEEILYPEIARCFAMRGAEVFVHPTSESGTPQQTSRMWPSWRAQLRIWRMWCRATPAVCTISTCRKMSVMAARASSTFAALCCAWQAVARQFTPRAKLI